MNRILIIILLAWLCFGCKSKVEALNELIHEAANLGYNYAKSDTSREDMHRDIDEFIKEVNK